jgi:hypothetical protein
MKSILILALAAALTPSTVEAARNRAVQDCTGVITKDGEGSYFLKPDPGSTLWCHAYLGHEAGDALVSRVLKVCPIVADAALRDHSRVVANLYGPTSRLCHADRVRCTGTTFLGILQ